MSKTGRSFMEMLEATAASPLDSKVIKATDSTVDLPKAKHMEALLLFTHLPDYNQGKIVQSLLMRMEEPGWVTVLKALICFHRLIRDGHERFSQFLATSSINFNLAGFVDATSPEALAMTGFIRSYSNYISEKINLYRVIGFDICHVRASENMAQLASQTLPEIHKNLKNFMGVCRGLLACVSEESPSSSVQAHSQGHGSFSVQVKIPPAQLFANPCIKGAVRLLLKDALRIFVCMNECVVKVLETYFSSPKKDAVDSLALHEEFVGVCQQLDIFFNKCKANKLMEDRHVPELTTAPKTLLPAMRDYVENYGAHKQTDEEASAMTGQLAKVKLASTGVPSDDTDC